MSITYTYSEEEPIKIIAIIEFTGPSGLEPGAKACTHMLIHDINDFPVNVPFKIVALEDDIYYQ